VLDHCSDPADGPAPVSAQAVAMEIAPDPANLDQLAELVVVPSVSESAAHLWTGVRSRRDEVALTRL
jgi:hypothetical protein